MQSLRQRLAEKPTLLGTFCALGTTEAVELACHAGFDCVIVDGQHGAFDTEAIGEALRAIQACGGFPIVRSPVKNLGVLERFLDMGYPALLAPMVNTAAQAQELVTATHYPPQGHRSQSSCRASLHYGKDYRRNFNADFSLLVMIEHIDAVRNIEAIAAQPGVAGCFIGPTDLASSLAEPGDLTPIIARVKAATEAAGKITGIAASSVNAARDFRAQGFHLIALATDRRLLTGAMADTLTAWREGNGHAVR